MTGAQDREGKLTAWPSGKQRDKKQAGSQYPL